ncbi:LAME_0D01046g1_1 [Lachancea meyersii CBS 8951]|uniref:LAME_0D01046g1_1 n=1 Tax=Lachancea meyersii CBS 8951 TaxID=1266667 RepID=A0A1G4J6A7_9SACH|nr:LAME_0D01046g1_1 [Lachancea meyersii CBS 8951]
MGPAEFGTAKYLNKKMKAKGLQKLRFYCQVCQKQCRDENGYKAHCRSPFHTRNVARMKPQDVNNYTNQFEQDFLRLLRLSHGEKKIEANKFYNEFIQDRDHIHMNATKFPSLTKFVIHLSKTGKIRIHGLNPDEDGNGIDVEGGKVLINYIDDSFENMQRQNKVKEIEGSENTEEDIKMKMLKRQIAKAATTTTAVEDEEVVVDGQKPGTSMGKLSLAIPSSGTKGKVTKKRKNIFKKLK